MTVDSFEKYLQMQVTNFEPKSNPEQELEEIKYQQDIRSLQRRLDFEAMPEDIFKNKDSESMFSISDFSSN